MIGNGSGMAIEHNGSSSLHTSFLNTSFKLNNLMHVSYIAKNLINVSEYNVFFEFFPNFCFVKSQVSMEILLQGKLKDGLYLYENVIVPRTPSPTILHSVYTLDLPNFHLWHRRLGQPAHKTLYQVLSQCNISCYMNENDSELPMCDSCCMGKLHQLPYPASQH